MTSSINSEIEELLELFREIVIYIHKQKLVDDGDFEYDPNEHLASETVDFDPSFELTYDGMWINATKGTYWPNFIVSGQLGKLLAASKLPTTIEVALMNEQFGDSVLIDKTYDLNNGIYKCCFVGMKEDSEKSALDLHRVKEALEKKLTLQRIKFS